MKEIKLAQEKSPQEQIIMGMKLIQNGCKKIIDCKNCPFKNNCFIEIPTEWEIENEDN